MSTNLNTNGRLTPERMLERNPDRSGEVKGGKRHTRQVELDESSDARRAENGLHLALRRDDDVLALLVCTRLENIQHIQFTGN